MAAVSHIEQGLRARARDLADRHREIANALDCAAGGRCGPLFRLADLPLDAPTSKLMEDFARERARPQR